MHHDMFISKNVTVAILGVVITLLSFICYIIPMKFSSRKIHVLGSSKSSNYLGRHHGSLQPDLYSKLNNSSHGTHISESGVFQWVETYTIKVDYGDSTCKTTKKRINKEKTLVKILRIWKAITVRYNITYFLTYGSLLGAVRNSDFIPWDGDIDVMVDMTYYDVLLSIDNR